MVIILISGEKKSGKYLGEVGGTRGHFKIRRSISVRRAAAGEGRKRARRQQHAPNSAQYE